MSAHRIMREQDVERDRLLAALLRRRQALVLHRKPGCRDQFDCQSLSPAPPDAARYIGSLTTSGRHVPTLQLATSVEAGERGGPVVWLKVPQPNNDERIARLRVALMSARLAPSAAAVYTHTNGTARWIGIAPPGPTYIHQTGDSSYVWCMDVEMSWPRYVALLEALRRDDIIGSHYSFWCQHHRLGLAEVPGTG